jgi:ATP-dependent exoDNAse (exonuclease V) alpha subunit
MAIFHLSVKYISRNQGRSSVGASAYRAGEKLYNDYDGQTHDYTKKSGIIHKEILLPENAPQEFYDRQTFWNAVEQSEKRKDSRTAREIEIALPRELSIDEQVNLVRGYVQDNLISRGMCVDVSIHSGHQHRRDIENIESKSDNIIFPNNPHAHILIASRPVEKDGFCKKKNREWESPQNVRTWREQWANAQNREFERKGLGVRVSHESNINRGIKEEPTKHLGHKAHALEKRGIRTERGDENRKIQERNRMLRERQERYIREREQNREREQGRSR